MLLFSDNHTIYTLAFHLHLARKNQKTLLPCFIVVCVKGLYLWVRVIHSYCLFKLLNHEHPNWVYMKQGNFLALTLKLCKGMFLICPLCHIHDSGEDFYDISHFSLQPTFEPISKFKHVYDNMAFLTRLLINMFKPPISSNAGCRKNMTCHRNPPPNDKHYYFHEQL